MPQVLHRASAIIDVLAAADGPSLPLGEIAVRTGLAPATCARLLASLLELGWVDQRGPRRGYRLGPRLGAIAQRRPYRHALFDATRDELAGLAQAFGRMVTLATIRGTRRQVLLERLPGPDDAPLQATEIGDLSITAGGRAMLAALPIAELDRLLERLGLPDAARWPGADTRRRLLAELAAIRDQGYSRNLASTPSDAIATAFDDGEGWVASIGSHGPRGSFSRREVELLLAATRRVRRALGT